MYNCRYSNVIKLQIAVSRNFFSWQVLAYKVYQRFCYCNKYQVFDIVGKRMSRATMLWLQNFEILIFEWMVDLYSKKHDILIPCSDTKKSIRISKNCNHSIEDNDLTFVYNENGNHMFIITAPDRGGMNLFFCFCFCFFLVFFHDLNDEIWTNCRHHRGLLHIQNSCKYLNRNRIYRPESWFWRTKFRGTWRVPLMLFPLSWSDLAGCRVGLLWKCLLFCFF